MRQRYPYTRPILVKTFEDTKQAIDATKFLRDSIFGYLDTQEGDQTDAIEDLHQARQWVKWTQENLDRIDKALLEAIDAHHHGERDHFSRLYDATIADIRARKEANPNVIN